MVTSWWLSSLLVLASVNESTSFTLPQTPTRRSRKWATVDPKRDSIQEAEQPPNFFQDSLRKLAELSLKDYQWRSNVFKSNEADRLMEDSLARLQGKDPAYTRPMDASALGPLGRWEKESVEWLGQLIDEEGRRAQQIVDSNKLVRPINNFEPGPLGVLEKRVVDWLQSIQQSEKERLRTKTLRPKDLAESTRGPLGQLELQVTEFFDAIRESERIRMEQSKSREEMVRPIDIPGPLGELERRIAEIFQTEQLRVNDRVVRPMDAPRRGPLGEAEQQASEIIQQVSEEESKRLNNIRETLREKRPMQSNRESLLGFVEALLVGILRGPQLLSSVIERVKELLSSEPLTSNDTLTDDDVRSRRRNP